MGQAVSCHRQNRGASGEVVPRVGFIVTNLAMDPDWVVCFYNQRGAAEQRIKEGKYAFRWTLLSYKKFRDNEVRQQQHALAYNLVAFLRCIDMSETMADWSLTSLQHKLIKIGTRVVRHARATTFQLAEVAVTGRWGVPSCRDPMLASAAVMRVAATQTQNRPKMRICNLIRTVPDGSAAMYDSIAANCLICAPDQATLTPNGMPLGECRTRASLGADILSSILLSLTIYASGLVFYSALFLSTANQDPWAQKFKIGVAAIHCFVVLLPIFLAQSRYVVLKVSGYASLAFYHIYAFFVVGFFPYFGFVPELYAYDFSNAADMGKVLNHYIAQIFGLREILLLGICAAMMYLTARHRVSARLLVLPCLSLALLAISLATFGLPARSDALGNVTLLRRFGPVVFGAHSIAERMSMDSSYLAGETDYPGRISAIADLSLSNSPSTVEQPEGIERVILLQIESFGLEAIDAQLSGLKVMPFVTSLRDRCLNYTNFFTLKAAGGSSDAEFSIATGLLPSLTIPSLRHFDYARLPTIYERLADADVVSTYAHNNEAGFYGRYKAYQQMKGIRTQFITPDRIATELAFAERSLGETLKEPSKTFYYFFNFQSHGPYRGYSKATEDRFSQDSVGGIRFDYLATMSEVDGLVERLFEMQRPEFDEGKTLFILTADHPSYVFSDASTLGKFRIPLFVCHESFDGITIKEVFSTLDLHVTLLNVFGIEPEQPLGRTLFGGGANVALLPNSTLIRRSGDGEVITEQCGTACQPFIDYTAQYLLLSP